ncbi:TetR/AcrR family transcriptional regulator [Anaerocolumna xylanovorans]|uniref:Transcriptional regulator, TetR family n=1 Tax=Anaerocolumna xylanovorans DSM 12503 TaxID=1121345 RepID=A0A1M7YIA7_9FIRM|nr:TetR/AcrR family transcriptional regulator [Anaerocolumna xylanovorans]SHO52343.1 transcriptional regulator, TetR family [Anaerocolumna xylanovorans DSM 12503]
MAIIMGTKKDETKKKIMEVTINLLDTVENPNDITVRKIAEAAGIGVGLINYHYESRDNLIKEAVSMKMESLAEIMEKLDGDLSNPIKYLKEMLVMMSDTAVKNPRLNKFSVEYDLLKGDFRICLYLLPILRKIYNDSKSETDLRLIAFQIIVAMQSVYLRQEVFHMLTGIDIGIKKERDNLINSIVDNLIS